MPRKSYDITGNRVLHQGQAAAAFISTLDFTASALKLAGGDIPAELDGADAISLLTKKSDQLTRSKDLFCDRGNGIALQRDGWKIHRWWQESRTFQHQGGSE